MNEMTEADHAVENLAYALFEFIQRLKATMLDSSFEPEIYMTREHWDTLRSSSLMMFELGNRHPGKYVFRGYAVHLVYDDDAFHDFRIVAVFK